MSHASAPESPPEPQLNELLRRVDWRFLLRQQGVPRTVDLTSGAISEALLLVSTAAPRSPGSADLVVTGFPTRTSLRTARMVLRPGGEIVCAWQAPRPAGTQRARARLERAGFTDTRFYWPGPLPYREPQFWLPLDAPAAVQHVLSRRPPQSRAQSALRPLWRACERGGLLAPVYGVSRVPDGPEDPGASRGEIDRLLAAPEPWVLLTEGAHTINKVVGLPFGRGHVQPPVVVKFARTDEADPLVDQEAEVLRALEKDRPDLPGVPRLLAQDRRAGRYAIAQSAIYGRPLVSILTEATFPELAPRVTRWLIGLAGTPAPHPASEWRARLVSSPLDAFERHYEAVIGPGAIDRARLLLSGLGDLPLVCEHRDLMPDNVVIADDGTLAVVDWESAELRGLPGLDLALFLFTASLAIDRIPLHVAPQGGAGRTSHEHLLDASTERGRVAAACVAEYCRALKLDAQTFTHLRLLGWIVQSVIFSRRPEVNPFLGLATEELRRSEETG